MCKQMHLVDFSDFLVVEQPLLIVVCVVLLPNEINTYLAQHVVAKEHKKVRRFLDTRKHVRVVIGELLKVQEGIGAPIVERATDISGAVSRKVVCEVVDALLRVQVENVLSVALISAVSGGLGFL